MDVDRIVPSDPTVWLRLVGEFDQRPSNSLPIEVVLRGVRHSRNVAD